MSDDVIFTFTSASAGWQGLSLLVYIFQSEMNRLLHTHTLTYILTHIHPHATRSRNTLTRTRSRNTLTRTRSVGWMISTYKLLLFFSFWVLPYLALLRLEQHLERVLDLRRVVAQQRRRQLLVRLDSGHLLGVAYKLNLRKQTLKPDLA
jgi:hypothetical protein